MLQRERRKKRTDTLGQTELRLRLSALKLSQQSNTQWSRVLRFGDPNHSKPSRVPEFIIHLPTGKTLKPPPHLRI
jgi:hypothetical protein